MKLRYLLALPALLLSLLIFSASAHISGDGDWLTITDNRNMIRLEFIPYKLLDGKDPLGKFEHLEQRGLEKARRLFERSGCRLSTSKLADIGNGLKEIGVALYDKNHGGSASYPVLPIIEGRYHIVVSLNKRNGNIRILSGDPSRRDSTGEYVPKGGPDVSAF